MYICQDVCHRLFHTNKEKHKDKNSGMAMRGTIMEQGIIIGKGWMIMVLIFIPLVVVVILDKVD